MEFLRTAPFGALFTVTFVVAATFQATMTVVGAVSALLAPGLFRMNGAPASTPVEALGVVLFMLAFGLAMNAAISAGGAGLWLLVRRTLRRA